MLIDDLNQIESDTTQAIAPVSNIYLSDARAWLHHENELQAIHDRESRARAQACAMREHARELQKAIDELQSEAIRCEAINYIDDCPAQFDTTQAQVILITQYGNLIDKVAYHSKKIARHLLTIIHRA